MNERKTEGRKAEKDHIEEERLKRREDEEIRLKTMKTELQQTFEQKTEENSSKKFRENPVKVKPPKSIVSKFECTNLDWLRFGSQFETEKDLADIAIVNKFSYLKELLIPKVRPLIDGLPFNIEG